MKTINSFLQLALLVTIGLGVWSCGDDTQSNTVDNPGVTATQTAGRPDAKLVSEKWLRGQFPVQLGSQKLNQSGATTTQLGAVEVTKAQATFGDEKATIVAITDLGKLGSNLGGVTPWLGKELNIADGASFQRTSYIENYPSLETYNADEAVATVSVLVGNRFLVAATSKEWKTSQLRDAVATMELDDLAKGE